MRLNHLLAYLDHLVCHGNHQTSRLLLLWPDQTMIILAFQMLVWEVPDMFE